MKFEAARRRFDKFRIGLFKTNEDVAPNFTDVCIRVLGTILCIVGLTGLHDSQRVFKIAFFNLGFTQFYSSKERYSSIHLIPV